MRFYKVNNNTKLMTSEEILDTYFNDPSCFENTDRAEESLDEGYESYTIAGRTFSPSEILYNCDENAYNDYVYEEAEAELEYIKSELIDELDNLEEDEFCYQSGYRITFMYDDEDTDEDDDEINTELCDLIA